MKKLALLVIASYTLALIGSAQDKGYIGIGLGGTFAVGDFASSSATNSRAGYATSGAVFDITFASTLGGSRFGVAAQLRGTATGVNAQALAQDFANALGTDVRLEAEPWSLGALLAGGYANWPLNERISIEAKALLGYAQASSPRLKLNFMGGGLLLDQESANATTFAYSLGTGLKINLGRRICLLAGVDYLAATAKFTDVRIERTGGAADRTSFEQPFAMIDAVAALAYRW